MGLFSQQTKDNFNNARADVVLKSLKPKDGKTHVLILRSFSKVATAVFGCDEKYTNEVDAVLVEMQNKGYEIVDVKINSAVSSGAAGVREGYVTCIIYR